MDMALTIFSCIGHITIVKDTLQMCANDFTIYDYDLIIMLSFKLSFDHQQDLHTYLFILSNNQINDYLS